MDIDLSYAFQMADWKIERAKQHIDHVQSLIRWITDRDNYLAIPHQDPKTGHYSLRIGPKTGFLPHNLPVFMGDAIHNLATALDYLWSGLARKADPSMRVHFPSHETRQNLADAIKNTPIKKAFPDVYDLVLDELQPYKDGNFSLWVVKKLDNIDKHRLLLSCLSICKFGKFVVSASDGSKIDLSNSTLNTYGPELVLGFTQRFQINDDSEMTIDVIFKEEVFTGRQPVFETLVNLTEVVSQTSEIFKKRFLRERRVG